MPNDLDAADKSQGGCGGGNVKELGLAWRKVGATAPVSGQMIINRKLGAALVAAAAAQRVSLSVTKEITFTTAEWDTFGIHALRIDDWIKADGCYFSPLPPSATDQTLALSSQAKKVYRIETAILRVRDLLQLGLGEAGSKIISTYLQGDGHMQLDKPGSVMQGIFGFCDIRNFTDCTEVLRADIVKLVNAVGSHVHTCTVDSYGAPNKNIGDAFLLVWKPKGDMCITTVADSSLRSYVRVIVQMQMCDVLRRLERRSALQQRMPGFRVRLGFGLHYGWAVEGAIGSEHKIDVSYLAPDVNMAARLEAATKQYGTAILLSGSLCSLLTPETYKSCRLIDRVTVKGSTQPMTLFTYDVPDIHSRGGTLPDETNVADMSISNEDFFSSVVPPSTSSHLRKVHTQAIDFYLGGSDGSRSFLSDGVTQFCDDATWL